MLALVLRTERAELPSRIGLTVSGKVGGAVVRNRVRRRLRELYRAHREFLPPGLEVVVIARAGSAGASWAQLSRSFERLAGEIRKRFGRCAS